MVPNGTSTGRARHTVLARDVSSNAADHRTLCTARRLRVACNNQAHNHQPAEKFGHGVSQDAISTLGSRNKRTWELRAKLAGPT
jgi:hypothetical protein